MQSCFECTKKRQNKMYSIYLRGWAKNYKSILSATFKIVSDPNLHCLVQIVVEDKVVETS